MNPVHTFWYQYAKALVEAEKNIKSYYEHK